VSTAPPDDGVIQFFVICVREYYASLRLAATEKDADCCSGDGPGRARAFVSRCNRAAVTGEIADQGIGSYTGNSEDGRDRGGTR
jgi:hypothetical protein